MVSNTDWADEIHLKQVQGQTIDEAAKEILLRTLSKLREHAVAYNDGPLIDEIDIVTDRICTMPSLHRIK